MAIEQRTVLGQVGDVDHARRLYLALQNSGIDHGDIRFGGEAADAAQRTTERRAGKRLVDERLARHVARRVVQGALAGGLLGVSIGVVLGLVVVVVAATSEWWWVGIGVAVFGALGAVLGAFISTERGVGVDDGLELGFTDVDGPVWMAVRVRDGQAAEEVKARFVAEGVLLVEEHEARRRGLNLVDW